MTLEEASEIANKHIMDSPVLAGGYRLARREAIEYPQGWYFDYRIIPIPPVEDSFAGAPGFMVDKSNGTVRIVSWHERRILRSSPAPESGD